MVRTHVAMFKRREMTVSQVADKVLYPGLIEMQKLDAQGYGPGAHWTPPPKYMGLQAEDVVSGIFFLRCIYNFYRIEQFNM